MLCDAALAGTLWFCLWCFDTWKQRYSVLERTCPNEQQHPVVGALLKTGPPERQSTDVPSWYGEFFELDDTLGLAFDDAEPQTATWGRVGVLAKIVFAILPGNRDLLDTNHT